MVRLIIVASAVAGMWYLGSSMTFLHGFAFGLLGLGFTWLTVSCIVVGVLAFKYTK
jgi:hypothetical protein